MSDRTAAVALACATAAVLVAVGTGCGDGDDSSARPRANRQADIAGLAPPAGVHSYRTRGYERIQAGIASRFQYPGRSAIAVRHGGCGFSERWSAGTRRSTSSTYCLADGGRRLQRLEDVHRFLGQPVRLKYACRGPVVPPPARLRPGYSWTDRCHASGADVVAPQRVVGIEPTLAAGRRFTAVHLRSEIRFTGVIRGASTIDSWVARSDGLVLRRVVHGDTRVSSPIGTVKTRERYELRLRG